MKRIRLIMFRSLAQSFTGCRSALVTMFLFAGGLNFIRLLVAETGSGTTCALAWALSAVMLIPVLAAMLTMRAFSDEFSSGAIDLMLTAPVTEREIVYGKFLAAFCQCLTVLALFLLVPKFILPHFTDQEITGSFICAFVALTLQSFLWCAVGVAVSACTPRAPVAAAVTILITECIPVGIYYCALQWFPEIRAALPVYPFERHVAELATGLFSMRIIAVYLVFAAFALFFAEKKVAARRFNHSGAVALKVSNLTVVTLAAIFSVLLAFLVFRFEFAVDLNRHGKAASSPRLDSILRDARGDIEVTCHVARKNPRFRAIVRSLGTLSMAANAVPGANVSISYVDPRWDLARSAKLVHAGVGVGEIEFRSGRRRVILPVSLITDGTALSSAVRRVLSPRRAMNVCFVTGHGESDPESYEPMTGFSSAARLLSLAGYSVRKLDLAAVPAVPSDCDVMVIAGPRTGYSELERGLVNAYLRRGGRLMFLAAEATDFLNEWGLAVSSDVAFSKRTLTGNDVVTSEFSPHPITAPLEGASVVLDEPLILKATARPGVRAVFKPLITGGGEDNVIAASFQAGEVARDLAIRPTRIVTVGCNTFLMNGRLEAAANANGDFFLNAISWLAGVDDAGPSSLSETTLNPGMDRALYVKFGMTAACAYPALLFFVFALAAYLRSRRR